MAQESAIIFGLSATAFIFAYYAFNLRESDVEANQHAAVFLAFVSLLFTDILFYTLYNVAKTQASYLLGGPLDVAMLIIIWVTNLLVLYLLFAGIYQLIRWIYTMGTNYFQGRRGE